MKKILSIFIFILAISSNSQAIETSAKEAILLDYNSNEILFKKNESLKISPALLLHSI